jgi:2-dehydro-3-deoxygluconokinase
VNDVVTFGETMAALRGDGPLRLGAAMQLSVAGAEANVAIGLSRLGHRVAWIGRVGEDELGALVLRTLRAEGVDTGYARTDPDRPTGLVLFERRIADVVRVSYYRTGSAGSALTAGEVLPGLSAETRLLHVTGVTPALGASAAESVQAAVRRAGELGVPVSLDVNYRSRLWSSAAARAALRPLIGDVGVLFASTDELPLVAPDPSADAATAAAHLLADGVAEVVVKRGASGADAHTAGVVLSQPAVAVGVVDVVGAGDAFVAGYLSALLDELDVAARLERGVATAAFAVARHGDWEGLPDRADLALLRSAPGTTLR